MRCSCGASLTDSFVCETCIEQHERVLGDLPGLLSEAVTTLTRQDHISRRVGSASTQIPLPFNWNASVALGSAHNTVSAWTAEVSPDRPVPPTMTGCCLVLLANHAWPRTHVLGPQMVDEMSYLAIMLRRTVDLPVQRWFAGPCGAAPTALAPSGPSATAAAPTGRAPCVEPLYAHPAAATVRCPACGMVHSTAQRREWLIAEAENALLPLATVWAALGTLAGSRPPWSVVRRWPTRSGARRLHVRGLSLSGDELFRVGDVLDMVRAYPGRLRTRELSRV